MNKKICYQISCWVVFLTFKVSAQHEMIRITGFVSYKSSRNIYAKFPSTNEIQEGDTLSLLHLKKWHKVLIVQKKSSTSCITESIADWSVMLGDTVSYLTLRQKEKLENVPAQHTPAEQHVFPPVETKDSILSDSIQSLSPKEIWNGRIAISTNASISPNSNATYQRLRFAVSLKALNIHHSAWSAEIYSTYRHRYGVDQSTSLFNDIKLFTLAVNYHTDSRYSYTLGRKINNQVANLGAIDGIQVEMMTKYVNAGAFAGTRPDFRNFGFNINLPQFGVYLSKIIKNHQGMAQTSLAFAEQQYHFRTDRRFLYFQHNNNLFSAASLFLSSELDLYQKVSYVTSHSASFTSFYANLRYKIRRNLSASTSYDQRRNIIYYESYQTFIDQLLAQETRQGWRLMVNYTPFRGVTLNTSAFYRYQGSGSIPTKNYIFSAFINNLPGISANLQLAANLLKTSYFEGTIFSGRLSKSVFKGKCNIELQYRKVDYNFFTNESRLSQHIAGLSAFINISKKTALSCSYEGTFEQDKTYHRYFITLTQRIKS